MTAWLRRRDRPELLGIGVLAGFFFIANAGPLSVSVIVSPEAIERGVVVLSPPCPTLAATGRECGSCGLTRGFCAMSRLRLDDALAFNRAAPWLYVGSLLTALASGGILGAIVRELRARTSTAAWAGTVRAAPPARASR